MLARVGDWLVVSSQDEGKPDRHAVILAVRTGGRSPYTVRWMDTGTETVVFPGPNSRVVSAGSQHVQLDPVATRLASY